MEALLQMATDLEPAQRVVVESLVSRLSAAGVTKATQLHQLFGDGPESVLGSAFPDAVEHDADVVGYLRRFQAVLPSLASMEQRLGRQAVSPRLDDAVAAILEESRILVRKRAAEEDAGQTMPASGWPASSSAALFRTRVLDSSRMAATASSRRGDSA